MGTINFLFWQKYMHVAPYILTNVQVPEPKPRGVMNFFPRFRHPQFWYILYVYITGGNEGQNTPFRGKNSKWHDFCWFCLLGVLLITKKNPNKIPCVKTCFLAVFSKWPLLIYCNITKNARIINDTSFPTFLGSRNPMKVIFLRSEFNFSF